jgi:hypothetical protein
VTQATILEYSCRVSMNRIGSNRIKTDIEKMLDNIIYEDKCYFMPEKSPDVWKRTKLTQIN